MSSAVSSGVLRANLLSMSVKSPLATGKEVREINCGWVLLCFTWDLAVLGSQTANDNNALDFSRGYFQKMNTGLCEHEDLSPESPGSCNCFVGVVACCRKTCSL